MAESSDMNELMEEVDRYLAAVDLFRALGCEPAWRVESRPEADAIPTAPPIRRLPTDLRLH